MERLNHTINHIIEGLLVVVIFIVTLPVRFLDRFIYGRFGEKTR